MTSLLTRIYPAGMHLRYLHGTFGANRAIAIRVIVIIFGLFIYLRYAKKNTVLQSIDNLSDSFTIDERIEQLIFDNVSCSKYPFNRKI
jgi:hypothetical protein